MSDKKMTELPEHVTNIVGTDLLTIVANTAAPMNYRVQVKYFLSRLTVEFPVTTHAAMFMAANVVANSTAVQSVAEFRLNAGNTSIGSANAYGVVVNHTVANTTSGSSQAPVAFLGMMDAPGTSGRPTTYLLDVGMGGTANVSANMSAPNSSVMLTVASGTVASHLVRCRINGTDMWILASNTAPA